MKSIPAPGAGYTTFRQLFLLDDGTRIRLTVPDYQRAYDWRDEHRQDLFDDLERLAAMSASGKLNADSGHFCGTVICTPEVDTTTLLEYSVVDGQQRLTTLALLHCKLARAAHQDQFLLSDNNVLFRPQNSDRNYFNSLAKENLRAEPATLGQKHYKEATDQIDRWITTLGHIDNIRAMVHLVETRLQFIFFVLPNAQEVSKVFETINNRGKPLTQMDLVKNHLIYMQAVNHWDGQVDQAWSRIQELALKTDFKRSESVDTVLRAVVTAMFHPGKRDRNQTDHSIIKQKICKPSHAIVFERFLSFLESSFQTFHDLRNSHVTGRDNPVNTQLTYLNHHPNISGALPLILVRQFCRLDATGADVLAAIEKANFRLYGLLNAAKRSNSHHVILHKIAHSYFNNICETEIDRTGDGRRALSEKLICDLTAVVTTQHKDGFSQIIKALTLDDDDGTDFFHWDALRYFLARWEESMLSNQSFEYVRLHRKSLDSHSNDYLTKEHIYPTKGDDSIIGYRQGLQQRRLGNFMLLPKGVNSSLSNKCPADKIREIHSHRKSNNLLVQNLVLEDQLALARKFVDHLEERTDRTFGGTGKRGFNAKTLQANSSVAEAKTLCDLREEQMIHFALEAWRMPGESLGENIGQRFLGMFSFRFEDGTYLSTHERPATKETTNYVLAHTRTEIFENSRLAKLAGRLHKRDEILNRPHTPVSWEYEEHEQRNAA